MSHQASVSITKLRFDKSPNIIMGGERNGRTQLETIPRIHDIVKQKYTLFPNVTFYFRLKSSLIHFTKNTHY